MKQYLLLETLQRGHMHTKQTPLNFLSSEEKSIPSPCDVEINSRMWEQAIRWNFSRLSLGDQLDILSEFIAFLALTQHKEQESL